MSADDHELVAAQLGLAGDLVGVDVDQLHHPVRVGSARRGHQIRHRLAGDLQRRVQRLGDEADHVGASRGLALVVTSQGLHVARRRTPRRTGRWRYGTGFAGSETYSSNAALAGARRLEATASGRRAR